MRHAPARPLSSVRTVSLALAGLALAERCLAVDRTWINPAGGTFTAAGNWSGGAVPSAADRAVFELSDAGYTVNFVSNVLTNQLLIRDDVVTFDLSNFTYSLNDSIVFSTLIVGESANLRVNAGTLQTAAHLAVGAEDVLTLGSAGKLNTGSASISGRVIFASTQTNWVNTGVLSVGSAGIAAEVVADFSASLATGTLVVGSTGALGYVQLDDQSQLSAGTVLIASGGAGSMELLRGSDAVLTGRLSVGHFPSGTIPTDTTRGTVLVDGAGASLAAAELLVGGTRGEGTLTVRGGATLSTTGAASIGFGGAGSVLLDGPGTRWNAATISVGTTGAALLDIRPGTSVVATGPLNVATFGTVNLDAATLSVASLSRTGVFNFNSGTLIVTGSGLTISGTVTHLPSNFALNAGKTLGVNSTLTIGSGGVVSMRGGQLLGGTVRITSGGQLLLDDPASVLSVGSVQNDGGKVLGNGTVFANYVGTNNAELRVGAGERMRFTGTASNAAQINLFGGELEIDQTLSNQSTGRINGRGVLRAGALSNSGTVGLSAGLSDVFGALTNTATGKTIVTGGAVATFWDNVTNQAGSELRVSTNSTAVFFGAVTGTGAITGTGTVVFEGPASLGAIDRGGTTVVEPAGSLAAQHVREDALVVRGPVSVLPNGTTAATSRVNRLEIDGGKLDLNDNDLVIDYAAPSPIQDVRQQIRTAFNGGAWNGAGGITTSAGNASNFGLGYAEAGAIFTSFPATFSGQAVDNTSVLVMFTRFGDANLSGTVNLQDFNRLASNFGATSAVWSQGDFNYDGTVNLQDFNRLASNFGLSAAGPTVTPQDWSALASAVPEPMTGGLTLLSAIPLLRRRRALA